MTDRDRAQNDPDVVRREYLNESGLTGRATASGRRV
jgi:hypothetical protein